MKTKQHQEASATGWGCRSNSPPSPPPLITGEFPFWISAGGSHHCQQLQSGCEWLHPNPCQPPALPLSTHAATTRPWWLTCPSKGQRLPWGCIQQELWFSSFTQPCRMDAVQKMLASFKIKISCAFQEDEGKLQNLFHPK